MTLPATNPHRSVATLWQTAGALGVATLGAVMGLVVFLHLGAPYHDFAEQALLVGVPLLALIWAAVWRQLLRWERDLAHWQHEAAEASRAKTDFLANMSHEIRTPLNGIIGMLELFSQMDLTDKQTEYVQTIRKSSEQLLLIINDVLDVAKIEAGQLSLEPIPFDITSTTTDVIETFLYPARQKNLELVVRFGPGVPARVVGDPGRYRQILTNLVGNALKFTGKGYVFVELECAAPEGAEAALLLKVTDTGIGIPAAKLGRIFDRFMQADASTTRQFGGTGLGLAITRELTRLMGGDIAVESTEGIGSCFKASLQLPVSAAQPPAAALPLPPRTILQGQRVLVVDDQPLNRRILREILEPLGAEVIEADTAAAALHACREALAAQPLTVAVIDNLLPDSNGLHLGQELHKLAPAIQLVLHTSLGQRGDARRYAEVGYGAYLLKPYTPDEVLNLLTILLGRAEHPNPLFEGLLTRHAVRELVQYGRRKPDAQEALGSFGKVLVVEDDPVNQQVLSALLRKLGAEPVVAGHGAEGVAAVQEAGPGNFALVLMDMNMPVLNGPDAARQIRAWEQAQGLAALPIVALTANALKEHRDACLAAGMSDYLTKPVTLDKLRQVLESWAGEAGGAQPLAVEDAVSVVLDNAAPLDEGLLEVLTEGDEATRSTLLNVFFDNTRSSLETLAEAEFGSEDWRKTSHRLKGSAASLGMGALSSLAAQAETVPEGASKEELLCAMEVAFAEIREFTARWGV